MATTERRERCGTCRFSIPAGVDAGGAPKLICRRHPPSMLGWSTYDTGQSEAQHWQPDVSLVDWCGEYEPAKPAVNDHRDEWEKGPHREAGKCRIALMSDGGMLYPCVLYGGHRGEHDFRREPK